MVQRLSLSGQTIDGVYIVDPVTGLPIENATADREVVVTTYRVKTAFTDASVGDTITAARVLDVSGATATQVGATLWYNETTSTAPVSAPAAANLELTGANALTAAQLASAGLALDTTLQTTNSGLGSDGATPPVIAGTGVRGWLRATYESIGNPGDSVAGSDTTFSSLISLFKRSLTYLSLMVSRAPVLVSGRMPVDASGVILSTSDKNGSGAVRYTTDTIAVTGSFSQIMCLTSTTFSAMSRTGATGSLVGVALPAGTLLVGPFTGYTLTSGAVAAYA